MSKKISVLDGSAVYQKLPGKGGSIKINGSSVDDTVLGQVYASELVTLKTWEISGMAYYKGIPGYSLTIKKSGTSTSMTGEATTLVSGKTYQINDTAKRLIDLDTAVVVNDGGSPVAATNILNIDYLWGKVTFVASYTVSGAITIDGNYLPLATLGVGKEVSLSQTLTPIDVSEYDNTQASSGFSNMTYGLKKVALTVNGVYSDSNDFALLIGPDTLVIEVNPDGAGLSVARGYFRLMSDERSGDVGSLETENLSYVMSVPNNETLYAPFVWQHDAATTLDDATRICLDAWETATNVTVKYESLTAGVGKYGAAVVSDISMSNSVSGQTEFTIKFTGTDNLLTL